MKLVFVRHGESAANAEGRLQGHAEFRLSEKGRAQSHRLRERFQREGFQPTHIYSSPQQRTAETVRIVASHWPVPIVYWNDLKEHDVGIFSGLTWNEISAKYPEVALKFKKSRDWGIVEGAEPLRSQRSRARQVVEAVIELHASGDTVIVFTHGGILQHLLAVLMGTEHTCRTPVRNTAIFDFALDLECWSQDGGVLRNNYLWRVEHFNDTSHLTWAPTT